MAQPSDTLRLTDFLLARIADDEADRAHAMRHASAEHLAESSMANEIRWVRRDRAECEAKLRIIGHYEGHVRAQAQAGDSIQGMIGEMAVLALGDVLKMIALPYADHPDYRAEWRP